MYFAQMSKQKRQPDIDLSDCPAQASDCKSIKLFFLVVSIHAYEVLLAYPTDSPVEERIIESYPSSIGAGQCIVKITSRTCVALANWGLLDEVLIGQILS